MMDGLMVGRVMAVHQHDNSLDIQLIYDGSRLFGVPLLSQSMTTSSGFVDMHHPEGNAWDKVGSKTRDVNVAVAHIGGQFVAIGFFSPQVNQMLFDRVNFKVDRHASDVYSTIDKDGNIELAHPSGTFVRIGTSPAHEDLTGKDFDKLWKIDRNKTQDVWLSIAMAKRGVTKATVRIDPDGNISVVNAGTLNVATAGAATLTAPSLTVNAAVSINGPSLRHNGVNVGSSHRHSGVKAGLDTSSGPQ